MLLFGGDSLPFSFSTIPGYSFLFEGLPYPKEIPEAPDTSEAMSGLERGKVEVMDNLNKIQRINKYPYLE